MRQRKGEKEQQALAAATASSSRTPPHPHPHPLPQPDDDNVVFIPQYPNDNVLDIATTLMLEDMNRFVQELEDREQSEVEMRKLKEDLNRRIHDQKLVVDIHNILDQQWEKYDDNYHHPYHTAKSSPSSSSSKALVDSKCFILYFKGLVSEESVRGIMVNVAGAGVAICDFQDNLILEARKNVEAMVNGVVVSGEVAGLQSLIEDLNKAKTLDLKIVTFACDDYNW